MHYERKGAVLVNGGKSGYGQPRYGQQNNDNRRMGNSYGKQQYRSPKPQRPKQPKKESRIYFIALLPNAAVGKEIIRMKQEFAEFYDARKALKVLPYITIQAPFTADPVIEKDLCDGLTDFASVMQPFDVELDGFGSVALQHRRLIFFNVVKTQEIMHLHRELILELRKSFGFSSMLAKYGFNPHISLALNDIDEGMFEVAKQEYEEKEYRASFRVNNIYLLRHTGTSWEVLHKSKLGREA
jgi:2'-5' RNA ligase